MEGWEPGKAFEYLILRAFELEGAVVTWPYVIRLSPSETGGDTEQIDGAVYVDGLACIVEAKDTANTTRIEPIAKMRNQLLRRPSSSVGLISAAEASRQRPSRSSSTSVHRRSCCGRATKSFTP